MGACLLFASIAALAGLLSGAWCRVWVLVPLAVAVLATSWAIEPFGGSIRCAIGVAALVMLQAGFLAGAGFRGVVPRV